MQFGEAAMSRQWDIFCSVVDNYGDIGVTWRLARQLASEHHQHVRLWVDDLNAFARICPEANRDASTQQQQCVEVRAWRGDVKIDEPVDIIVEAFACSLPLHFEEGLSTRAPKPCWINLEYLSAEPWTEGCHGLPSPQAGGLAKYFFFPGFTCRTGGLLREQDLIRRRDAFQANSNAQEHFLSSLGVRRLPGARLISLFTYENSAIPAWLDALCETQAPTQILVPEGRALPDLSRWAGSELGSGGYAQRGSVEVQVIPFVSQQQYDLLLWACDLNIVRGEDSFVRAQWASRPMLWHIYPQDGEAHLDKLNAFLDLYLADLPPPFATQIRPLWLAWNTAQPPTQLWTSSDGLQAQYARHAHLWCDQLCAIPDLATQLMNFVSER
jgi:uncharacterized repeat protein (TIGR03837 family)